MNIITRYMTQNDCYKADRQIVPKGIMVHSTASPGVMAAAWFDRWNNGSRDACVHAFVDDKQVCQYLPWNWRGWHAGGKANDTHIAFEMCEPAGFKYAGGTTMAGYDAVAQEPYFQAIWRNAVELCALLCQQYGLTEKDIICHSEAHKLGIASNHADVMHWFPKHGESMDTFRAAVRAALADAPPQQKPADPPAANEYYRVRKSWADKASQMGAFKVLDNAKVCADQNAGYSVFDEEGKAVYPTAQSTTSTYTVAKGDTLWSIAADKLGSGTRYTEIMQLNGLPTTTIHMGQVLKISE